MLRKIVRWLAFGIACLVTLAALVIAEENWRGKRAWERYKQTVEATGEPLTLASLAPPPVPDDQNFAMTPLLKPLFPHGTNYAEELIKRLKPADVTSDRACPSIGSRWLGHPADWDAWRDYLQKTNAVQRLETIQPELNEISAAGRRPYARFAIPYEDGVQVVHALLPHFQLLRMLARIYSVRATVGLMQGQVEGAAADVETIFRLADSLRDEPFLISQLVREAILQIGLQGLWQGLIQHQWSDAQLAGFQSELQRGDFVSSGLLTMRGERAYFNDTFIQWISNAPIKMYRATPRGFLYQNMLAANRFYEEQMLPVFSPAEHRIDPRKADFGRRQLLDMRRTPYNIFIRMLLPALSQAVPHFAGAQTTGVDEAIIACALERYRLAHGRFPESLDVLVPQFIAKLPNDVINGLPLKYRRIDDGQFILYSVGWNEKDDGGVPGKTFYDEKQGDWVWFSQPQPQPSASEQK